MSTTIAEQLITSLADHGVEHIWGVVGDALNPVVDAIRLEDRIQWMGVRHEEAGAFAASAQAQLSGELAVCMGTVGPGAIHLLNGLYDAAKSHAPVLAIVGQVPTDSIGTNFFQEVNNDRLFADVAVWTGTVADAAQMPALLEQAVNAAIACRGVAVLSLPANMGAAKVPQGTRSVNFVPAQAPVAAAESEIRAAAELLNSSNKITLFAGRGAREARTEVISLAEKLNAPIVLSLQGKESLEDNNPYQVGQTGLIGNPAAVKALDDAETIMLIGTDFPYSEWLPEGKNVIQLDRRATHIGRRISVTVPVIGFSQPTLAQLLPLVSAKSDEQHLKKCTELYAHWEKRQTQLAEPDFDDTAVGSLRSLADNPEGFIRPEAVAAALDEVCASDAIFTSDTGMSTVWLSRLLPMRGQRRLIGSYNLGSMANAMPMTLGAQASNPQRQVIGLCGDGGLMMLLGDLRTAVSYDLPVTLVVFNNAKLGMVKLEQEQAGLPEYGTSLDNPRFVDIAHAMGYEAQRVSDPAELQDALRQAVNSPRPALVEVMTNPEEVSIPGRTTAAQALGFLKAKAQEFFSRSE